MNRLAVPAFVALLVIGLGQAAWYFTELPATVASHFDASGHANGWMSREAYVAIHVGLLLFIAALLEGIARVQRKIPDELINVPHREYWLAPERRDATCRWLTGLIRTCGCVVLAFFIGLFHQVYRANTGTRSLTFSTTLLLAALLLAIAALLVRTLLRFRRPSA